MRVLVLMLVMWFACRAGAQPSYFTIDVQSDELVSIESGPNGQAILQVRGPLGVDMPLDVDLEWHDGQLLALTAGNGLAGTCQLFRINPTTGAATLLATLVGSDGGGIARAEALVSMPGRGLVIAYGPPASLAFSRRLGTLHLDGTVDLILDLEQFRTGADADALAVIGSDQLVSIDNFYFINNISDFLRVETIDLQGEDLSTRFEVNQGPGGNLFTVVSDLARSPGGLLVALRRTDLMVLDLDSDEFLPALGLPGTSLSVIRFVGLAEIEDPSGVISLDGCPVDADGDGRVDIDDLYHLTQNPADINGDGVTDADDTRCLEAYLRCVERLDMSFRPGEPAADGNVPFASYRQTVTGAGLQQSLRVIREPSPDDIGCVSQSWTATLVGTRPGLSGPVEIRLDRDGFLWKGLWTDAAAASPGNQQRRGMLTCEGSAVEYVAASPSVAVGSADAARALILLDGMNISGTAMLKGIADPATRVIGGGLLDPYVDVDGNITLPPRGMLVCFELDPVDQSNSAFAFDDVVLLVDNECGGVQTPATARYIYDYEQLEAGPLLGQDGWSAVSFAGPTSLSVFDSDPDLFGAETKSLGYVGFQGVTNFGRRSSSSDFPINELPLGSSTVTLSFDSCVEFCSGNNSSVTFYVYNDSNGSGQVEPFELLFGFGYNHVGPSDAGNGVVANTPSAYLFRPGGGTTPDNISADLRNYTAIAQDQGFTIQFILEIDTSDPMNYTADLSFRPINQGPAGVVSPPELQGIDLLLGAADFAGDVGIITRIDAQLSNCGQCCPSCLAMDNLELLLVD